jgi:hypothetical protein
MTKAIRASPSVSTATCEFVKKEEGILEAFGSKVGAAAGEDAFPDA